LPKKSGFMDKSRDELVYLQDIWESIIKIENYVLNLTERAFEENSEKQDAVIRRIEVIGEAAKNISSITREKYPHIPWREMAGMRDVVIHQYFGVSIALVWRVAVSDIPELKEHIEIIIQEMESA